MCESVLCGAVGLLVASRLVVVVVISNSLFLAISESEYGMVEKAYLKESIKKLHRERQRFWMCRAGADESCK